MTTSNSVKLTSLTTKGGCGCKIGPADLSQVLQSLPQAPFDPNLLVGLDTSDDAGVYKLTDDLAIVQTLDFFTPIVDDPYDFGQIAATNAISDVYAMGGKPITALNIVAFPIAKLDKSILADILRGAGDKLKEAGVTLVGGHSIDDQEPKFGLSVTGTVHPDKVRTNAGAKPNDKLVLTKPIGVGIYTTSLKNGALTTDEIEQVTSIMTTLNKTASEVMSDFDVHAATDVTGFGLLGHATEMAKASNAGIRIFAEQVPILPRTKELAEAGRIPGGTKSNYAHVADAVTYADHLDQLDRYILCDAVTSGGLLISVSSDHATELVDTMKANGVNAAIIGEVTGEHKGKINVV
ncbi:selenide, water dikinase SelD [Sporosarcina thermotolerans]|uniref:Selenide, water dikinase n=1 Tax=Sporosarcina thermotolerans TaxID=633404 RepID=A0AAW9A8B4_9BACL|nr:selenide, water dikinase SelD [Sporosarcina thermotolerans]MDW0115368.1 selenide, water dikinase SelD [Sporosarcina thermotolerans]WHT47288.1 selenide, water dikinase SelD [Sporosarcina thermotolerans]